MKYVLCYGDSNTWGCNPDNHERYEFSVRWPGVLQRELGETYHIYENALNGRTTVFEDPIEEGRCGKDCFSYVLESCSPLDAVILMLGTNDVKSRFHMPPWDIGWGIDLLIQYIQKKANCFDKKGNRPKILIVAPPKMGGDWSKTSHGTVFDQESVEKAKQLPEIYQYIAKLNGAYFLDAALYTTPGVDCIHITVQSHEKLGKAIAEMVRTMLEEKT